MPSAEITVGKFRGSAAWLGLVQSRREGLPDRLCNQRFLGRKMPIKSSVGQTRVLHYLRHSHIVEAALAKQARRGRQDSCSMLRNLLSAHFHVGRSECLDFITGPIS